MGLYGNTVLRENKNVISVKEDNLFEMTTSVVYEEYLNCKSLLEACTDEDKRAVLESKVEVLYEVSIKDIIDRIKELWKRFKVWVKEKFDKIFNHKKDIGKSSDNLLRQIKSKLPKIKNKLNESALSEDVTMTMGELELISIKKEIKYYRYANCSNGNIGSFSGSDAAVSIEQLINLILKKPEKLKQAIDKDSAAVKAIYVDLIESNDNKIKEYMENIHSVFLTSDNFGSPLIKEYNTWEEYVNGIEKFMKNSSNDISNFERHINNINKAISELERNLIPKGNESDNHQVVSMYASVSSSAINDLKKLLEEISGTYNKLTGFQKTLNNKLEEVNRYFDYIISKNR